MPRRTKRGLRLACSLAALACLAGTACGNRVEPHGEAGLAPAPAETAPQDAAATSGATVPGAAVPGVTSQGRPGSQPADPASGTVASSGAARPADNTAGRSATPSPARDAGQNPGSGARKVTAPGSAQGAAGGAPTPGVPPPAGGAGPPPAATRPSSPVKLGNIGVYSGPAGSTTQPSLQGAQLWVRHINAKGGLNGHPVELIVFDDAGDPARNKAAAVDAIERRGVVAFLNNNAAIAGGASTEYITSKRVPVIGSLGDDPGNYTSPMFFPQQTSNDSIFVGAIASTAQLAIPAGRTKLGMVYCAEAPACPRANKVFTKEAKGVGFNFVYQAQASIAQPDYTAECLAARNAGVDVLWVLLDSNSVSRLAASCGRQGFKPQFASAFSVIHSRFKDDPNLDGFIGSSNVFPWFQTGTPEVDEYQAAYKAYGANLIPGIGLPTGWTSGKLLEKAAARLPEPPTSDAILHGLWSIKGDTLGGITQPLTFVEGQPAEPTICWFNVAVKGGAWVSPDTFKLQCK